MKDRLGIAAWINRFPNNPTQTMDFRFRKQPGSKLTSMFTKHRAEFESWSKDALKTIYSEYLE